MAVHTTPWGDEYAHNGVDRLDNAKGYTLENSVPCCKHCNIAKRSMTVDEFKQWISKVYAHQNKAI